MSAKQYRTASSVHGGLLRVSGVPNVAFGDRVEVLDHRGQRRNGEVIRAGREHTLLQVYEGDKVMVRVQVGAHEEGHNFSINGIKWLQQWNSGYSGFRNSQMAGISEYFVFEVPALGRVRGDQGFEDFLYQTGSSVDARWNGSWGLMRSYGGPTAGVPLQTLPTNADGQVPPRNASPGSRALARHEG